MKRFTARYVRAVSYTHLDVYKRQDVSFKVVKQFINSVQEQAVGPVSYTHLDVYKRQAQDGQSF